MKKSNNNPTALLHLRAEKEYKAWQTKSKNASSYERVVIEDLYIAVLSGEFDNYASSILNVKKPLSYLYNELDRYDDFIYSAILDILRDLLFDKGKEKGE